MSHWNKRRQKYCRCCCCCSQGNSNIFYKQLNNWIIDCYFKYGKLIYVKRTSCLLNRAFSHWLTGHHTLYYKITPLCLWDSHRTKTNFHCPSHTFDLFSKLFSYQISFYYRVEGWLIVVYYFYPRLFEGLISFIHHPPHSLFPNPHFIYFLSIQW